MAGRQPAANVAQLRHRQADTNPSPIPCPCRSNTTMTLFTTMQRKSGLQQSIVCVVVSNTGRQLFQEALLDGTMTGFFKLMEQFK